MSVIRIAEFDTWRPGYGLATVTVLKAGGTEAANVYTDEDATASTDSTQTLLGKDIGGISYGKFAVPLYTDQAYQLQINSVDQTGITRPALTTLDGEDASPAEVKPDGGAISTSLEELFARPIDVRDYGAFVEVGGSGASASTNTATIVAAVGVAGARGGAMVRIPPGTFVFTDLTLPTGVVLEGEERGATVLQSTYAGDVVTIGGDRAGLRRLTLDGVSLVADSVGFFAVNKDGTVLDDVEIKRFETDLVQKGGTGADWHNLIVSDASNGAQLLGDTNSGGATAGAEHKNNRWTGGKIELCSNRGLDLAYIDANCSDFQIEAVGFESNTGTAARLNGARSIRLGDCWWTDNTVDLDIDDADPANANNTTIDVLIDGGSMNGGTMTLTGNLESVIFRRVDFLGVETTITTPSHNILIEDCREDSEVTFAGSTTAWIRSKTPDHGSSSGLTTGNSPTKTWAIALDPGQRVAIEYKVIGRQRNGERHTLIHGSAMAYRPGAELDYDTQTANFTVGDIVTGAISGATGRIVADNDAGATGTLTLQDVSGTFVDNEALADESTGAATANGTQSTSDCVVLTYGNDSTPVLYGTLDYDAQSGNFAAGLVVTGGTSGATGMIEADTDAGTDGTLTLTDVVGTFIDNEALADTDTGAAAVDGTLTRIYDATAVANGPEVEIRVTGQTSHTIEWTVDAEVVSS